MSGPRQHVRSVCYYPRDWQDSPGIVLWYHSPIITNTVRSLAALLLIRFDNSPVIITRSVITNTTDQFGISINAVRLL